jgi:DNA-binding SARP family transcriptional activator
MIRLNAFGNPSIFGDRGTRLDVLMRQPKRFAVLIFLVCSGEGRVHRRDELTSIFWPEADGSRGRNALRQTLHAIRKEVGAGVIIGNGSQTLQANLKRIDSDVGAFHRSLAAGSPEAALELYKGDFLLGFHLPDSPEFDFWVEERRNQLAEMACRAAKNLAHRAEGDRNLSDSLYWWRKALDLRPFDEAVVRRLIALHAGGGNRGKARAEFDRFRHRMETELGLEPSKETLDLLEKASHLPQDQIPKWVGDRRRDEFEREDTLWRRATDQN